MQNAYTAHWNHIEQMHQLLAHLIPTIHWQQIQNTYTTALSTIAFWEHYGRPYSGTKMEAYTAPKMEEFAIVIPCGVTAFFVVLPHCGFLVVLPRQELSLCRRPAYSLL